MDISEIPWELRNSPEFQVLLAAEAKWREIVDDSEKFIETYVKLEDRDRRGGIAAPFALWPEQKRVLGHMEKRRLLVFLKTRQCGLTWLALAYAIHKLLTRPGYSVVALSHRETPEAKELIRRLDFILRHLPGWMTQHADKAPEGFPRPVWERGVLSVTIHHPDDEDSTFVSMASSPHSGRSLTANLVILDEWGLQQWARQIFAAAYPTISRPTGGKVFGLSTMQLGSFFHEIWDDARAGRNDFHPIFLNWKADPRRTREWHDAQKRTLPHSWRQEFPETEDDALSPGEGAAFSAIWVPEVHIVFDEEWYPPAGWKLYRAYDSGFVQPACCLWFAMSPDGWVIVYREFYERGMIDAEQAEEIRARSRTPSGVAEEIAYTLGDPACWARQSSEGRSTADAFRDHGVPMIKANNDRINGWKRLRTWLKVYTGADTRKMARLRFTPACENTLRTLPRLPVDKNNLEDIDTRSEDHAADVVRYFVMQHADVTKSPEMREREQERRQRRLKPGVSNITGY